MDQSRRRFLVPKPTPRPGRGFVNVFARSSYDAHKKHATGMEAFGHLTVVRREAMATKFEVKFPELEERASVTLCCEALDVIDDVELQLTVYRDSSEVSRLNAGASQAPVPVSENLYELIERSRNLWEQTEGAFDITSGPLLKYWGIHTREQRLPSEVEIESVRERVGMQYVRLHPETKAVSFERPGMDSNFGSNGKGYALDCAAGLLREVGMPVCYVQGGHSSHYGLGAPEWDAGWRINITSPLDIQESIATVRLRDMGLATSGAREVTSGADGHRQHHIVDPRTGRLAEALLSVTVVCPRAEEADGLATAVSILGVEWARKYCQTRKDVGMILVPCGGAVSSPMAPGEVEPIVLGLLDNDSEMVV